MAQGILSDIRKLEASVLDPGPELRKEVQYFVNEFEEKRKESEIDHLFKVLETLTELKDTEISKASSLADIHFPNLLAQLQVAQSITDKLITKFTTSDQKYKETLEKDREQRTQEWDTFVHHMTKKCINIDTVYKDKQEEVRKLYSKAQEPFTKC